MADEGDRIRSMAKEVKKLAQELYDNVQNPVDVTASVMGKMPDISDDDVDLLLPCCHREGMGLAALVALRYGRLDVLLQRPWNEDYGWSDAIGFHGLKDFLLAFPKVLRYLAEQGRWGCMKTWLLLSFEEEMLFEVADLPPKTGILQLMDADLSPVWLGNALSLCTPSDLPPLRRMLEDVRGDNLAAAFESMVRSDNAVVRQAVAEWVSEIDVVGVTNLTSLVGEVCRDRQWARISGIREMVLAAYRAGLFGHCSSDFARTDVTPVYMAVINKQPDLVELFYKTGAVSGNEALSLCQNPILLDFCYSKDEPRLKDTHENPVFPRAKNGSLAHDMWCSLWNKACVLPPLQTLGKWVVSRLVGWGHGRHDRIDTLPVDEELKRELHEHTDCNIA